MTPTQDLKFAENDPEVMEAKKIIESLSTGPTGSGGFLNWNGDLLQEAEFNLARYAERISEKEAWSDSMYTQASDVYKGSLARARQNIRIRMKASGTKFTRDEIDDEALDSVSQLQANVHIYYAQYKQFRGAVASIQRFLLALTHRINELQSEKRYKQ